MTDCIIVGAGPAGGAAAYHLAKRGLSVVVLEKAALPRSKPCGGGVSPAIAAWFDFDFTPAIAAQVDQVRFTWQQGDPIEVRLRTEPMWMVQREVFDAFLLQQAAAAGANVQDETAVTGLSFDGQQWQVTTNREILTATYVIAADGAMGICAKLLGLKGCGRPAIAAVAHLGAPDAATLAQFDFGQVKNGFIWNFPQGDRAVVSAGTMEGQDKEQNLQTELQGYLGDRPATIQPAAMNLWSQQAPLHTHNALLVGDSAGLADPLLAEGIRPALLSGVKAAEAIAAAQAGDAGAIARYSQVMHDSWGHNMVLAQRLSGIFYKFTKLAYKVGIKQPFATTLMSQILCGQLTYSAVLDRAMAALKKSLSPFG